MTADAHGDQHPAGLSPEEAQEKLKQYGPNQPASAPAASFAAEVFRLFANPLALVLLAAAGVSASVSY